jgi:hypothetical protein
MYKLFVFTFLFTTLLNAANPKAYAVFGDTIYNNIDNIKKLTKIGDYYLYVDDINDYIHRVNEAKKRGMLLDEKSPLSEKRAYLNTLRKLSKENDYYSHMAQTSFINAMQNGDSLLFTKIINSGLIDTKAHKKEILDYYFAHSKDINTTGVIQTYLDENREMQRREALKRKRLSKKEREEQRIKRLRELDKKRRLELEQKLDKAVKKKKEENLRFA